MKLEELHTDILWEGLIGDEPYIFTAALSEGGAKKMSFGRDNRASTGFVSKIISKQAAGLFKNPVLAGVAAGIAITALAKYRKNKRNTITFYAADPMEKRFYKKMIKDLLDTGNYKKVKSKYVKGGYMWLLKRNLR